MNSAWNGTQLTRQSILESVLEILTEMTADWDLDFDSALGPETKIVSDLGFESIDVVQFIVAIEERFQRRGLPFEELIMVDGRYVDEVRVDDAVDFLYKYLNRS